MVRSIAQGWQHFAPGRQGLRSSPRTDEPTRPRGAFTIVVQHETVPLRRRAIVCSVNLQTRSVLHLGSGCIGAAVACAAVGAFTGDPLIAGLAFVGVLFLTVVSYLTSAAAVVAAVGILLLPPSVVSEDSSSFALLGAAIALFATIFVPSEKRTVPTLPIIVSFCAVGICMIVLDAPLVLPALYLLAMFMAIRLSRRPTFARHVIYAVGLILAPLVISYIATIVTGFVSPEVVLNFGNRRIEIYRPFTLATGGPPIIPGTRRFTLLVGEPGLSVFYVLPVLACILGVRTRISIKIWGTAAVALTAVSTQSYATLIAVVLALSVYVVAYLTFIKRRLFVSALFVLAAAWFGVPLVWDTLIAKSTVAAESVTDRGLFNAGAATAASLGNINLMAMFNNSPLAAVALTIGLTSLCFLAVRTWSGLAAFSAFALTAIWAQPSQWQVAAWLLLVIAFIGIEPNRVRRPTFDAPLRDDAIVFVPKTGQLQLVGR